MAYFTGAVGQQRVPDSFLSTYLIPIPPLEEQKHIAVKLKEKMAQVKKLRESIEKQIEAINALPGENCDKIFFGQNY